MDITEAYTLETETEISVSSGMASEESLESSDDLSSDIEEGSSVALPELERIIEILLENQAETETTTTISYVDDVQSIKLNSEKSIEGLFITASVIILACIGLFKHWGTK